MKLEDTFKKDRQTDVLKAKLYDENVARVHFDGLEDRPPFVVLLIALLLRKQLRQFEVIILHRKHLSNVFPERNTIWEQVRIHL